MTFSASSPGSAEPLAAITRSAERSYLAIVSSGRCRMRWSITGTTTRPVARLLRGGGERLLGVEAVAQDQRRGQAQAEEEVREAPGVEHRRGDHRGLAGVQRDLGEQRRGGTQDLRLLARGALGRARGAGGEDDRAAGLVGRDHAGGIAALDHVLQERTVERAVGVAPGDEARAALRGVGDQARELLVVDQRDRLLARDHVGDLRSGERGVQVQRVGAELGAGDRRLDEVAVVAAQDRHAVALVDARVREGVGEAVGAPVELREGQRAELVDQRGLRRGSGSPRRCSRPRASGPSGGWRAACGP